MIVDECRYDWFHSVRFAKIVGLSIAIGIASLLILHGTWSATIGLYISIVFLTVLKFPTELRGVTIGNPAFLWINLLLGAGVGLAGGLVQGALMFPCILNHCAVDHMQLSYIALAIFACIVGPVAETIFFNGGVQTGIYAVTGSAFVAFIATAVLFTAIHGQPRPYIVIMAVAFAFLRYRNLPLITIFVAHALANAITYGLSIR